MGVPVLVDVPHPLDPAVEAVPVIRPEPYDRWDYIWDSVKGWRAYWRRDFDKYFEGSLKKDPLVSTWGEWKGIVWFLFCVVAGIALLVLFSAPHPVQIVHEPRVPFPTFTTTAP